MNVESENSPQSPGDDPLDHLLGEARWPRATPLTEARVAERWGQVWSAQRRRERLWQRSAAAGVAASLLVAAIFGWSRLHRGGNAAAPETAVPETVRQSRPVADRGKGVPAVKESRSPHTALRPISSSAAAHVVARSARPVSPPEEPEGPVLWRPPNQLEEMLIAALGRPGTARNAGSSGRAFLDPAQAAVGRLLADPKVDPALVAASLRAAPLENEGRLLSILTTAPLAEQIAAVRLLGEIGSSAAVPALLRAGAEPNLHESAIRALSGIADTSTLNQLVREEPSTELRLALLAALLGRGDPEAVGCYLSHVESETMGKTALAAAELVQNPPMELLFSALHSPSELERLAAARVLGRIDGPATTERLIALAQEGPSRQEACVALLSSRGPEAVNFVTSARANPALFTLLQAASVLARDKSASDNFQPRS